MSQNESEYTARILLGEKKLIRADGQLDMIAMNYLMILAVNAEFEQEVRQIVSEHFDRRLRKCMRATIPPLLDILRNWKVVHGISNYMHFIAVSCPARGIPIEEFTNMKELRRLWRDTHLRRTRSDIASIASSILAGIKPKEIGVSQADADKAVDSHFGRNNPDPEMKKLWEAHKADYDKMKKLFAV